MIALFILLGLAAFAIYSYRNYAKQFEDIDKLPGPPALELAKELWVNSFSNGIITYYHTLVKRYGPVVKVWIKPFRPMIITTDVEYYNGLYKNKQHHIAPLVLELTFMGKGFSTNPDYDIWKKDKQAITKLITRNYIEKMLKINDRKYDEQLLDVIRRNPEKPIEVDKCLRRIFVESIIATFEHPHVDVDEKEMRRFIDIRSDFFALLMEKMNSLWCMSILHRLTRNSKLMSARRDEIMAFGREWVKKFRRVEESLRDNTNLVYAMMEIGVPDDRIADNVNTIIEGASDTAIYPLAMALREIGRRPEIQRKLLEEIVGVLGNEVTKQVTLADIDRMPYVQAVTKEAIRRYLPFPFLDRRTLYDMTIGGTRIPKGTRVVFDLPGILTSEENYDDPLLFKPERFLKENVTARSQKAFLCFGYGAKMCVGKYMAYAAMKLLIVKIVREFEILHVDHDVQLKAEIFFRSQNGIPVVFRRRAVD